MCACVHARVHVLCHEEVSQCQKYLLFAFGNDLIRFVARSYLLHPCGKTKKQTKPIWEITSQELHTVHSQIAGMYSRIARAYVPGKI